MQLFWDILSSSCHSYCIVNAFRNSSNSFLPVQVPLCGQMNWHNECMLSSSRTTGLSHEPFHFCVVVFVWNSMWMNRSLCFCRLIYLVRIMLKYALKQMLFLCYDLPSLATKNVQWRVFFLLFSFPITVSLILDFQKLPYPSKVTIIVNFDSTERRQFYSKALI